MALKKLEFTPESGNVDTYVFIQILNPQVGVYSGKTASAIYTKAILITKIIILLLK